MTRSTSGDPLRRFLRAVHRRMLIVRALEGAGAGLAIAAGLSLLLAVSLLWMGRDAMTLCTASLLGGAIIGALWPLLHRPTIRHAAMEADRQLDLADLLTTAWLRRDDADPWQRAVVAMAEQRCQSLSPSAVVLARFGTRAWSGIGLSAALVMTIAMLSTSPRQTVATTPSLLSTVTDEVRDPSFTAQPPARAMHPKPPRDAQPAVAMPTDQVTGAVARTNDPTRHGDQPATGSGSAQTSTPDVTAAVPFHGAAHTPSADGVGPAGGGAGTVAPLPRQGAPVGLGAVSAVAGGSTPWSAPSWPQDRAAAEAQIRSGQIKDEYRDVVRQYFEDR